METEISDTWYEEFFQGINCELWEKAIPTEVTKQEVEFLLGELNLNKGDHILDIPCGFGRHAVEFSKQGFEVTGIDISKTFLNRLTEKMDSENLNIHAIQADILKIQLNGSFAGAVCLGNSFGYFNIEAMKTFIEKVSSALESGGKFIINSGMLAESIIPNLMNYSKSNIYTVDNITMEVANVYHVENSYMTSKLIYTKEGKTEEHSFKHFVFTLGEVKRLLKSYGLRIIATYSSTAKEAYKLGDRQIYIVAEKE